MKEIKLYGIGNEENFNYYIFDKKQKVAEWLSMILHEILGIYFEFDNLENKKGQKTLKKINIEKYKDYHESINSDKGKRVDIFYGNKKMFITLICSKSERLKFNEKLFETAEMLEVKKIKRKEF